MMWRSNWLRNTFERFFRSPKRTYRRRPERFFYRPRLDYLEDRTVLSTLNIPANPGILTFTAGANRDHALSISLSGVNYTIADAAPGAETITLTGAGTAGWTGNGSTSVTGPASSVTTMAFDLTAGGNNSVAVLSIANAITSLDGGSSGNNILGGPNNTASWTISGANSGTLTGAGAAVTFANFQNLRSGSGNNTFTFGTAGASLAGVIDGALGGTLTIQGNNANHTWSITGANAGSVDVILPNGFTNVQNLTGGTGNDDFVFSGTGALSGTINGGGGTNTIQGSDNNHTWNVNANNSGSVTGMISSFANIQNLTGGAGNDDFVFADGVGVTGTVNGGSGGTDSLDYSAYTTGVTVNLGAGTATGTGSVANIHQITGGQGNDSLTGNSSGTTIFVASPGNDTINGGGSSAALVGMNVANNWAISSAGAGTLTFSGGTTTFTGVLDLIGGNAADTLNFSAVASPISLTVGGAGTLDGVQGVETVLGFDFDNMNSLIGSTGSSLCGPDNTANVWVINGTDAGTLNTISFSGFSSLLGGGGTATNNFSFRTGGSVSTVNGRAGVTNTLDFGTLNTVLAVTLNALGSTSGFQGTSTLGITTSFDNINRVIGTTNTGNTLTGTNLTNTWTLSGASAGTLASTNTLTFSNFPTINGGTGADTLVGTNANNTWNITAPNAGNITGLITFTSMENLTGGSGNDTFIFTGTGTITGTVDGGSGGNKTINLGGVNDTLTITVTGAGTTVGLQGTANVRFASFNNITALTATTSGANTLIGPNATNAWAVTAANAGSLTTGGQTMSFSNIQNLTGSTGTDTFTFTTAASSISGTIDGGGGAGVNTIIGNNNNNTWAVTGANAGGVAGMATAFQNIQNLVGGSGNDTFVFTGSGSVTGLVDGGGGSNTINLGGVNNTLTITVTGAGTTVGLQGTSNARFATFNNITNLIGTTSGVNTLIGPNATNAWAITAANAGSLTTGGGSMSFSNIQNLTGGTGIDTFTFTTAASSISGTIDGGGAAFNNSIIGNNNNNAWTITGSNAGDVAGMVGNFQNIQFLTGGSGNDTFTFTTIASFLSGSIDGGGGSNTIDLSALSAPLTITLTGIGTTVGFQGTSSSFFASFNNITGITATTSAGNVLIGPNLASNWSITASNAGTLTAGGRSLVFSNFPNLRGGNLPDTFSFSGAGAINSIDGGGGNNTIRGNNNNNTWAITGANAGGVAGMVTTFQNIRNLVGGSGFDTLDFSAAGAVSVIVNGTGSVDGVMGTALPTIASFDNMNSLVGGAGSSLCGPNITNMWIITGTNTGTLNGLPFAGFPNLLGGTGIDNFIFQTGGSVTGTVDGRGGNNTIQGDNANRTWNVTGVNAGNVPGLVGNFQNIQNLTGGSMNDTFVFTGTGAISGLIDGGAGTDKLDLSALNVLFNVTLTALGLTDGFAGTANVRVGSFTNIDNIAGTTNVGNTLTGTNMPSAWFVTGPAAGTLTTGTHTLTFSNFQNIAGSGNDTLLGTNANNIWNITGPGSGNIAGLIAFSGMRNLTGGSGTDMFIFSGAGAIAGTIDGLAGANSLDFSALGDLLAVSLNGITANGFLGTVNVRLGSFTNINKIVGSTNPGNSLTRTVVIASSTWTLSGPGAGTLTTPPVSLVFSNFPTINGPSAVVDTLVGTNANSTWNVTGPGSGNIVGIITFSGMLNLTGGAGNDMFVFSGAGAIAGTVNGGGGNNTIAGSNNTHFWNITGVNAGGVAGMAPSFLNIQNLVGGAGTDVFVFSTPGSFLAGNIDGGAGRDALNYSPLSMAFNITLTGLGTQDGFQGMATFGIGGTFNNIDVIYGTTNVNNTLRGANLTNTWALGGAGMGRLTSGANGLDFVNFPNLVGGPGIDTLIGTNANNIWYVTAANAGYVFGLLASFSGMENLTGGFGNDYFAFVNNATISGQVNGGPGGSDTLDLSTFTTPRLIQLVPATVHGFGGSDTGAPASVGGFDNIDTVFSPNGPGGNTLTGPNQDTIWNITGRNSGTLTSLGRTLVFSGFPNLRGGSFTDTFNFQPAGSLGGTIDGGPKGSSTGDSISWAAYAPRTVKMDAASGHGLSGRDISGNPSLAGFSDIDLVTGSNAGGNTLIGPDPGSLWVITGPNAGVFTSFAAAQESFTNFQNVVGGVSGSNVFTFQPGGTLVSLDGGGNGTVQWGGYGSDRNIALTGPGSRHGLAGTEPSLGRFDNVDTVFGNGVQTAGSNTLTGDNNASTFLVTGDPNLGATYTDNGQVLRLFSFQVFNGGAGANTFNVFSSPAGITTTINGFTGSRPAGGNDTFNLGSDSIPADGRNLGGLQGPVVIHAGATDGQTVGVTCAGSVFATVPVGNQLTLNDQDDTTAGLTYSLTENQFTRTVNQGGNAVNTIAPVTFTGIGYVLLNGGKGNDVYNVNLSPDEVLKVVGGPGANQLNFTNLNGLNNPKITPNTLTASGFQPLCFEGINNLPQVSSLTATATLTTDSLGQQQFFIQLGNSKFVQGLQINIKPPAVVAAPSFASLFGFGAPSVAVGRVQGNLFPDLIVGLGTGFAPLVTVYDGVSIFTGGGSNPRIVAQFYAYASSFTGGVYVAAGNIFSTTQASIITGAGRGGGPHVEVFQLNGRYNSNAAPGGGVDLRRSFFAYPETPFFGGVRVATGHVHQAADGLDDIITGAGPGGGPHVRVFNGQGDGSISSVIRSFFAYAPNFFGGIFVAAGNYANHPDGHVDILTGAGYGGGPHVRIFDSATLAGEASFFAFEPYIFSGVGSVAFAAPQIGSGNLDIFIGSGLGRPAVLRRIAGTGSQPAFDANGNLIVTDTPLSVPAGQTLSGVGVFVGGFPFKQGS